MKIKQISVVVLLWLGMNNAVQAQTFDKLWKKVDQAEKKSLPQTVISLTSDIYTKGEKEKNVPQMLKAYMWRMKYRENLMPDSLYADLKVLELWALKAENPTDRAVLHTLIAEFYANYAANNRWQLRQRTNIVDEKPAADIREWSANMFVDQVRIQVREALADSLVLLQTTSTKYTPFVELGEASQYYHHDMYHLLASRGVAALKQIKEFGQETFGATSSEGDITGDISRLYENLLSTYQASGLTRGYLLVTLEYLEWKHASHLSMQPKDSYLAALTQLKDLYGQEQVCAEVYLALARYAYGNQQSERALQWCDEAISRYPNYKRINALKNLRQDVLAPALNITVSKSAFPDQPVELRVSHRNMDGITVSLYRGKEQVAKQHYDLMRPRNYQMQDTLFMLKAPAIGAYKMRIEPDTRAQEEVEKEFYVSRFKVLTCRLPDNQFEVVVLDAVTGWPVDQVKLVLSGADEEVLAEFITDENGKALIPATGTFRYLKASKGDDVAMLPQVFYNSRYGYYGSEDGVAQRVTLLTDRSLYRPGQTVYVKGIAYAQQKDSANVLSNQPYTVVLWDANNQEIGKKTVRTNEFGSFTTDFALPAACLNGLFSVRVDNGSTSLNGLLSVGASDGSTSIRVEEYKRPTFEITFEKQQQGYQLGDEIQLKGNILSYSGVALQQLLVKYTVKRSTYSFWRMTQSTQIASGEVTADENGAFVLPVRLEENAVDQQKEQVYYHYSVEATVTNLSGETQRATEVVAAGRQSVLLQVDLKKNQCKDAPFGQLFRVENLNGQPVEATGEYSLYAVSGKELKQVGDQPVLTGTFVANKELMLDWSAVPSGAYLLKARVKDEAGREAIAEVRTVLFSVVDKRPVVDTQMWFYDENIDFDQTHPAVFYWGTSEQNAYVMMNVFCGNQLLESKVLTLSDEILRFEYPYLDHYGDGVLINFCMVKEGQVYQQPVPLKKRMPETTLAMKWDVFRDKLRPGQQEEWRLTIKTPQGQAARAEMLATLYDASLDKLWSRKQVFQLNYYRTLPFVNWREAYQSSHSFGYWWNMKYLPVSELLYDRFINDSYLMNEITVIAYGTKREKKLTGNVMAVSRMADTESLRVRGTAAIVTPAAVEESLSEAPADLRTNLAETAFFYPQLQTNERGEIAFSFTMPQSLTRWNFRGYAHTQKMMTGTLEGEATTSKEFMLQPNLPRFVRVGDITSLAASVINATGKEQSGTVSLTLFDPQTDKVIVAQRQKFSVEAGKSMGVNFVFTVSNQYAVLGCRLIADSGTFSDGEQQLIPVLSNMERVIDTQAMPIRGQETRVFSLDHLFNKHNKTATNRTLTIEFTGNPAWYAIQALPSLSLPTSNDALSWATAYYANSLASFIMNSQPKIKAVFESWKLQGGTKETFLSNLQKNQEVKNILLSESPWVLEAQTEAQQKERIATLFDLNNIRNNNVTALTKLKELQGADGAWSWCKGMKGNRYVTAYVAELNARLALLTGEKLSGTALALHQAALTYLHQTALTEYQEILKAQKKGMKQNGLSSNALQYLYLMAITGESVPEANRTAYQYYLSKVNGLLTTASMDEKAVAAIVLDKSSRKQDAQAFVASIKEHLSSSDEQGMFFAFNENPYAWGGMKMQAHVDVMEALQLIGGADDAVEEMKLWLLKQKQTQQWNSSVATADAVYALLMKGTNLLDHSGDVRIKIANEVMETGVAGQTAEAGLGYIKRSFTQTSVVNALKVEVNKKAPGMAWGAVYATYESPLSDVNQQGGELNVGKKLYVERMVNNVAQLQPLTTKNNLEVGDKVVVRLTIRADRAMDFVQLKDQRGACFEPIGGVSGYQWNNGLGYYVDVKDAATNFFFDGLAKGVYVLEYSYRVSRSGVYESGLATIQCAYAPEYASHAASTRVEVK